MRRLALVGAVAVLAVGVAACGDDDDGDGAAASGAEATATAEAKIEGSINVASWGGPYTEAEQKNFGDPFTAETGVKVNYQATGNSPTGTALLQAQSGNVKLDVVNSENPQELIAKDLLTTFPADLSSVLEETSQPDGFSEQSLKLGQTAVIIACNPDVMERCPTTAAEFFDVKGVPGPRSVVVGLPWTVMHFALVADGIAPDATYPMDIERAIAKLETIKGEKDVIFSPAPDQALQALNDEEVGAAILPHGTAYTAQKDIPGLETYWDEGTMTNDGLVVMEDAPNKDAALAYIKWIAEHPEAQAGFTKDTSYPTPTKELQDLIEPELWAAMPYAHEVTPEDDQWLVENMPKVQKAFQQFMAG